jgi:hypothetical protein
MNKDLQLFNQAVNLLIFCTTKDDFGNIRSRGIGTYEYFAEELNKENIVPEKGYWTENSLKLFFPRIMRRYPKEVYENVCDLEFVGRSAWEYLSYSKAEEIVEKRNSAKKLPDDYTKMPPRRLNPYTALYADIDLWKDHESADVERQDNNILQDYNKSKNQTRN